MSSFILQSKAVELKNDYEFKASKGWLVALLKRNNIERRKKPMQSKN